MVQISLLNLFFIFIGGGFGATLRYITTISLNHFSGRIWVGTLAVNTIGSVVFFLLTQYLGEMRDNYQLLIKVGILGSLTTFSTFSFEVVSLMKSGRTVEGVLVLLLNIVFGIVIGIGIFK